MSWTAADGAVREGCDEVVRDALRLQRDGRRAEGDALLRMLAEGNFPPDVQADAWRLLGQSAIAAGEKAEAKSHFEAVLAMVKSGAAGQLPGAISEYSALNQLMVMRLAESDVEGALEAVIASRELNQRYLTAEMQSNVRYHHAMLLSRLERVDEALEQAHEARQFAAGRGFLEAESRALALEGAIHRQRGDWERAANSLRVLWARSDDRAAAEEGSVTTRHVALDLVESIRNAGDPGGAIDFARQAVERLERQAEPDNAAPGWVQDNRRTRVSLLSEMSAADVFDRPQSAVWALDRLEKLFAHDAATIESIQSQRRELESRLIRQDGESP